MAAAAGAGKKKHMDVFLTEVFKQYIAIKDSDYKKAQTVFNGVFEQVKQKMCEQDNYFAKYCNEVLNAGSVYDGIKVGKLDEFDVDLVVRLPVSYEDGDNGILLENHRPGFVKLRITSPFDNLDKQPDWERCHKVTREWRDQDKYLLQSRFRQWMHRVVGRAVNELGGRARVGDVTYVLTFRESGPAYTLNVRSAAAGDTFSLDVDLVPCIRFMLPRWPQGYRSVEGSQEKKWLVVPKPLKGETEAVRSRCWRLAFHDFEREIMKGCQLLKLTIRLVKKLRDSLELKEIASYYIKTLFLWEIEERQDKRYWQGRVSVLFADMVRRLHEAVSAGRLRYYWHRDHNLLEALRPTLLAVYAARLHDVLARLQHDDVDAVVAHLLTAGELADFRASPFCASFPPSEPPSPAAAAPPPPPPPPDTPDGPRRDSDPVHPVLREILASNRRLESKFESLIKKIENKVDVLSGTVADLYGIVEGIRSEVNAGAGVGEGAGAVARRLAALTLEQDVPASAGGVEVPAGEVDVPADGVDVPAGEVDVPADGVDVPAGEVDVPAGGVDVPAGEVNVPAGEVVVPAGEVDVPVDAATHLLINI